MKEAWDEIKLLALAELMRDLDYYVESYGVHTCARLEGVQFLLSAAGWTGRDLLTAWAATLAAAGRVS